MVKPHKTPKQKTCRNTECRAKFVPARPLQIACGIRCALAIDAAKKDKESRQQDRKERAERKAAKEKLKPRSAHMREAQQAWNRYVRARDAGLPCASCGSMPAQKRGGSMDCSHYRSVGSSPHLRFHLHNAAAACVRCNRDLSGNIVELRKGLVARIGLDKVEAIECDSSIRRFSVEYLKRVKKIFTKKAKRAERRFMESSL